jgi:hypothetical protein
LSRIEAEFLEFFDNTVSRIESLLSGIGTSVAIESTFLVQDVDEWQVMFLA